MANVEFDAFRVREILIVICETLSVVLCYPR
jgi:hypothetical protein